MRRGVRAVVVTIAGMFLAGSAALGQVPARPDSLVLDRSPCDGTCPAYRLRLASKGSVHFRSLNRRDSTVAVDQQPAARLGALVRTAVDAGFFTLPALVEKDPELCKVHVTDHPTVTITIFAAAGQSRVEHYTGCYRDASAPSRSGASRMRVHERLVRLEGFASVIDSLLGSARWVRRPARQ